MLAGCSRKLLGVFFNNRSLRILIAGAVFIGYGSGWGCSSEEASSFEGQGGFGKGESDSHGLAAPDVEAIGGDFHSFGWKPFDSIESETTGGGQTGDTSSGKPAQDIGVIGDVQGSTDLKVPQPEDLGSGDGDASPEDSGVVDATVDPWDSNAPDMALPSVVCGNLLVDPGEDCEPGLQSSTNADCCGLDCQFAPTGVACGVAVSEPLCNPDFCDGQGSCIDSPTKLDGTLCATPTGGDTCCNGQCTVGSPLAGECDSCVLPPIPKLNVFVTESQSINALHHMDERWLVLLDDLGHSATLGAVSDLDNVGTLSNVDVLIISSAYTILSAIAHTNVVTFLKNGGAMYVQSEFKCNYPGNLLFRNLVIEFGGLFEWEYSMTGDFAGTKVLGCYGKYPESAPELSYFWCGCSVVDWSADTEPIVWYPPWHNLGFAYCAKSGPQRGLLVTTADQDWIRESKDVPNAYPLMRNIIARLAFPELCK